MKHNGTYNYRAKERGFVSVISPLITMIKYDPCALDLPKQPSDNCHIMKGNYDVTNPWA